MSKDEWKKFVEKVEEKVKRKDLSKGKIIPWATLVLDELELYKSEAQREPCQMMK